MPSTDKLDKVWKEIVSPTPRLLNTVILTRSALKAPLHQEVIELIGIHHFDSCFLTMQMINRYDNIVFVDADKLLVLKGRLVPYGIYELSQLPHILHS